MQQFILLRTLGLAGAAVLVVAASLAQDVDASLEAERQSQTSTAITIIFDNSGSMKDDGKMEQAKRAFSGWIKTLPQEHTLGLIDFERGQGRLHVPLGAGQHDQIADAVAKAVPSGKTPLVSCLRLAATEIDRRRAEHSPYERHLVVVFTDGYETVDKSGNRGVVNEIRKLTGGTVEVVGIGFHGQGNYMKAAATQYQEASSERELREGLGKVEAEIGGDEDLRITPADLAAMKTLNLPVPAAPGAARR